MDQVSFPSDVGDFATSLILKSDILISNLLKMKSSLIRSLSYGKNDVACIYLSELTPR